MAFDVILAFCAGAIIGILCAELFGQHIAHVIIKELVDHVEDESDDEFGF